MRRFLVLLAAAAGLAGGCGDGRHQVSGTVTYDGQPLTHAAVVFTGDTGAVATGFSDDSGRFTLESSGKPGLPAGSYKVSVTKTKIVEGQAPGNPDQAGKLDKGYLEKMKAKEVAKGGPPPGMMPGMPPVGGAKGSKADVGELPAIYASAATTPIQVQVPSSGPVEIKLEKK